MSPLEKAEAAVTEARVNVEVSAYFSRDLDLDLDALVRTVEARCYARIVSAAEAGGHENLTGLGGMYHAATLIHPANQETT